MKDLIIGAFTNYDYSQLKPWAESISESGFTGDKILIVGDASPETISELEKQNFKIIPLPRINAPIHVARFIAIYDYLKDCWQDYRYVLTTDVRDVYFQSDPMLWIEKNLHDKKLVAVSEGLAYQDEPWGDQNLLETYGPYIYQLFKSMTIYNVGVFAGTSEFVKDLCLNIFLSAIGRPIPIVDQAVFNMLIQTESYKSVVLFADQKDGFACHAGTVADPLKMEMFRPKLIEGEPLFENGIVKTSLGETFSIVHQYDRVPEWQSYIGKKYNKIYKIC